VGARKQGSAPGTHSLSGMYVDDSGFRGCSVGARKQGYAPGTHSLSGMYVDDSTAMTRS
jgi:hypothetical protein